VTTEAVLRRAVPGDAAALARVQVESWRAAYAGLMPDELLARLTVEKREARWQAILERRAPDERTFVAQDSGRVLGFACTGPSRDAGAMPGSAELYSLYLDPSVWRCGLGRALFTHAIADLEERGHVAVTLWVLEGNARARLFYEAAGMETDGGTKIEVDEGAELPHVRYRLTLRASAP
jgi:ribosomal protein S18 acetylase RimI-like enzyme